MYVYIQITYILAISKAVYFSLLNFVLLFRPNALSLNEKAKCMVTLILSHRNKLLFFQFSSVTQPRPTLCDPMDYRTPGFPVHHQLPELTQTHHVHWVDDAIQPSHPLSSPSPLNLQSFPVSRSFQWVSCSSQVAKVLEFQLQHQSPTNIQDWFPLGLTVWISLQSKELLRVFSNTTVQKHQFFSTQLSL